MCECLKIPTYVGTYYSLPILGMYLVSKYFSSLIIIIYPIGKDFIYHDNKNALIYRKTHSRRARL